MEEKNKLSLPNIKHINAAATYSIGNVLGIAAPEYEISTDRYRTSIFHYGKWDDEVPAGLYRMLRHNAQVEADVDFVVAATPVSSQGRSPQVSNFTDNISGSGKIYYSTSEVSSSSVQTMAHKVWRFPIIPTGAGSIVAGVYETQNQLFSKKVKLGEIRFYTEPLVANNVFTLAVLNSGSSIIAQNTYTVGTNVTAGDDLIRFKPEIAPIQAVGFRITNSGSANWTGLKLECDYENAGT